MIPLTKDVEVRYLFYRVGAEPPPPDTYYHHCRAPLDAFDDPEELRKLMKEPDFVGKLKEKQ